MWPDDTDWSRRDLGSEWVAQWPLCGAPVPVERQSHLMAYCDEHHVGWTVAKSAAAAKGIRVVITTAEDREEAVVP